MIPRITFTFARPRSASSRVTLAPFCASAIARLTENVDFPTPPFPLVMAMVLHFLTALFSSTSLLKFAA